MKRFPYVLNCLLLAFGGLCAAPAGAAILTGVVQDIGKLETDNPGISGVWVHVLDQEDSELEVKITDAYGRYRFEKLPDGLTVKVTHEKLGYEKRPTVVEGVELSEGLKPIEVLMLKSAGEGDTYYQEVALAIARRAAAETPGHESDLKLVEALEPDTREKVETYVAEARDQAREDAVRDLAQAYQDRLYAASGESPDREEIEMGIEAEEAAALEEVPPDRERTISAAEESPPP